ncbi:MAG: hypothetical protein AAB819_02035 [Patescibacteria group bacterium]
MTRASKIIIGLAVFTAITPLLGFPGVVKDGLTVIMGLAIAAITYWAEKHAKFCPECRISDGPHDHKNEGPSSVSEERGYIQTPTPTPPAATVGSDIVSRTMDTVSMKSEIGHTNNKMPSLSPFSFDAEKKQNKSRRNPHRTETVAV